jgi:hypothetical protein
MAIRDVAPWCCIVIKPELEKMEKHPKVSVHKHALEQGFLDYVEERHRREKPLFYDPARARRGKIGNPQFKKVGERLAEWIHSLGIHGPQPNHAWRHPFRAVARHVEMDREVEGSSPATILVRRLPTAGRGGPGPWRR